MPYGIESQVIFGVYNYVFGGVVCSSILISIKSLPPIGLSLGIGGAVVNKSYTSMPFGSNTSFALAREPRDSGLY